MIRTHSRLRGEAAIALRKHTRWCRRVNARLAVIERGNLKHSKAYKTRTRWCRRSAAQSDWHWPTFGPSAVGTGVDFRVGFRVGLGLRVGLRVGLRFFVGRRVGLRFFVGFFLVGRGRLLVGLARSCTRLAAAVSSVRRLTSSCIVRWPAFGTPAFEPFKELHDSPRMCTVMVYRP